MMKNVFSKLIAGLCFFASIVHASPGFLFSISESGLPAPVSIILCLNGNGPLSCQNYEVSAADLQITATVNHMYPAAGIKILTPGYKPSGCTPIANGYCLFSVSNTQAAMISVFKEYTVTPVGNNHLNIMPSTPQIVRSGNMQAFTVTAQPGYVVSSVTSGSCPVGSWSGSTYTTGAIVNDCSVIFDSSISISVDGSPLLLAKSTTGYLNVTNNSPEVVLNVMAILPPGLAANVLQDNSQCAVILSGESCSLKFTSNDQSYPPTTIAISGGNTNSLNAIITLAENYVTNGYVSSVVVDSVNNRIYLGGGFSYVGPNTGKGVPVDAVTGLRDTSYPKVNGTLRAVVSDGSGGWYIGGDFNEVGGLVRNHIAHILADKSVDPGWNPDANDTVYALLLDANTNRLYAGGDFTTIGGLAQGRVAALNASTGAVLGWGITANLEVYAFALDTVSDTLYLGGRFTLLGGQTRNRIASINATTGVVNAWNPNANGTINAILLSGTNVYVGGGFNLIGAGGQLTRNNIAALNNSTGVPTTWNPNANNIVNALAISGTTVYAGGRFGTIGGQTRNAIAGLNTTVPGNATSWNPNGGFGREVNEIRVDGSTVYASGNFMSIGGQLRNGIAALNATSGLASSWNPGASDTVNTFAINGSTIYLGGSFESVNGAIRNNIASLDATTGVMTSWNPNANSTVNILLLNDNTLYAGGNFTVIDSVIRRYIAAFNVTTGTATSWNPNGDNMVNTLALHGDRIYAGGRFGTIGGSAHSRLAALDINTGVALNWNPVANNTVHNIVTNGNTVYAAGEFTTMNAVGRNYIAALEASSGNLINAWNPNADSYVYFMALSDNTLYAGGGFNNIGSATRNYIAALDASNGLASSWNPNANGTVRSIVPNGNQIYAAGHFTSINGLSKNYLAALDVSNGIASSWDPSPNAVVYCMALSGSSAYLGGSFSALNSTSSPTTIASNFAIIPLDLG